MRLHRLVAKQELPIDLETAWAFFSDPWNLPLITPPWLHLRLTSNPPHRIRPGLIITYQVTGLPFVRSVWVTEITHVVDRNLFVDEQRFGPYRFWHHQHRFEPIPGGVRVIDIVHYALPLSPLSEPIHRLLVRPRLREIFRYRREELERRFGRMAPAAASVAAAAAR